MMPGLSKKRGNICEISENATAAGFQNLEDLDIILSECSCHCCQNLQAKSEKRKIGKQKGQGKSKLFRRSKSLDYDEKNFSEVKALNVVDLNSNETTEKLEKFETEKSAADQDAQCVACFDFLSDDSSCESDSDEESTLESDDFGSRFGDYHTKTDSWDPWNGSTIQIDIVSSVEEDPWNLPRMPYHKLIQSLGNIKARSKSNVYFQECKGFWGHTGGCSWCKESERKPLYKR